MTGTGKKGEERGKVGGRRTGTENIYGPRMFFNFSKFIRGGKGRGGERGKGEREGKGKVPRHESKTGFTVRVDLTLYLRFEAPMFSLSCCDIGEEVKEEKGG